MKQPDKKQFIDISGKIPPQAVDIEEAILGAIMIEKDAIDRISLKPEMFYKDVHQKIFSTCQKLSLKNDPIDLLTVTEQLRNDGHLEEVGGPFYVSSLTNKVASASNIEYHAMIISDKWIKREMIRIASEIQQQAYDDTIDTFDVFDSFYSQLDAINNEVFDSEEQKSFYELLKEAANDLERREKLAKQNRIIGIPTPIFKLTKWTNGWQPQQLIILAGRPGMGKTAIAISSLTAAAAAGYKPALFSLEMSDLSLVNRMIVGKSGISSDNFRSGRIESSDWVSVTNAISAMADYNILIDDKPKSINKIRSKVKTLHRKGLCNMVVLDYIQLSWDEVSKNSIREQEISQISRKLKLMAKELNIPVIALSQLNRAVENRPGKRPQLSDLRESGAIEQDADLVIFIHRPEKYGILEDEEGNNMRGVIELIIEKQREGQIGTIKARCNESLTSIYDYDDFNDLTYQKSIPEHKQVNQFIEPNKEFEKEMPF